MNPKVAAALILFLLTWTSTAQEVRVAAASDLDFALREIVTTFEAANPGVRVIVQLGSSGNFFTQIQQGLPVDVYFSANREFPERLEALGFVEPGTLAPYALGRMVVWVANRLVAQGLDPRELGMDVLRDPRVTQVALANPVHAPYGRGAVTLLERHGLLERTRDAEWEDMRDGIPAYFDATPLRAGKPSFEFVYGENVSQAAQIAASATNVGIFALSLAIADVFAERGSYWLAPLEDHLLLEQAYVIVRGRDRPDVRAFYDFVGGSDGREILGRYGFVLPGEREPARE